MIFSRAYGLAMGAWKLIWSAALYIAMALTSKSKWRWDLWHHSFSVLSFGKVLWGFLHRLCPVRVVIC